MSYHFSELYIRILPVQSAGLSKRPNLSDRHTYFFSVGVAYYLPRRVGYPPVINHSELPIPSP